MKSVFMRYPDGKPKAVTFSYDDGKEQDLRLAEIFDTYGIKGTFNLNLDYRPVNFTKQQIHEHFLSKGHEIAVHGAFHRPNGNLRPIEGIREVLDCRLYLEEICEQIIRGMAYPDTGITLMGVNTDYQQIKSYLTELDIAYARSLAGDNNRFMLPEDFHNWVPSVHNTNPQFMEYVEEFLALDISPKVYHARRSPRLLYVWGHSKEFDRDNGWEMIETVCKKLAASEEIWFATNIEIYDYVQAYKSLRYSADGRTIYNPTLIPVWMDVDGVLYSIGSGETIHL